VRLTDLQFRHGTLTCNPGEITIHCLEGALSIELSQGSVKLAAGELVFLAGGEMHGVKALADASALVKIALKP
jgi:quercetin dioxygenase-like cupin family protein